MTDLEINKALALAIGYRPEQMFQQKSIITYDEYQMVRHANSWCCFDYMDWETIGPIAERYDCFPMRGVTDALWHSCCVGNVATVNAYADTPQKAIAMAVIEGAKK